MDREPEALQRSFIRLLQDLFPGISLTELEAISQGLEGPTAEPKQADPTTSPPQDISAVHSDHNASEAFPAQRKSSLNFGELPIVQDRFHALLKRRLAHEIQQNPPLFPWETEIHDYETESASFGVLNARQPAATSQERVPVRLWFNQLQALNLPVALPDAVLTQLFQRCQEAVRSSLLEGARLVRAVEDLFPDRSQALNYLAGLVMTAPARSGRTPDAEMLNLPSYEAAEPAQQMVLSLLAAREIMAALTLTVSIDRPQLERQWLTELGALTLHLTYHADARSLRLQATLPCSGSIALVGGEQQAAAQRLDAGLLSVELFDLLPEQSCDLEIQLAGQEDAPLVFSIQIQ